MSINYDCNCNRDHHEDCQKEDGSIRGNAFDVQLKKCDSEVRADVVVGRDKRCVRLWGQVKDCDGNPIKDALVKLLKPFYKHGKIEYAGIAHTQTDCLGFYQFDICPEDEKAKFRVIVSKAIRGRDRVIDNEEGLCNPCND